MVSCPVKMVGMVTGRLMAEFRVERLDIFADSKSTGSCIQSVRFWPFSVTLVMIPCNSNWGKQYWVTRLGIVYMFNRDSLRRKKQFVTIK